jgi:hypothetical protein
LLHVQSATHSVDGTAEFNESPITRVFDDPTTMFANFRLHDGSSAAQPVCVGTLLIGVHQARIANNVDAEDCDEPTFNMKTMSSGPEPRRAQILVNGPECQPSHRYESASGQQSSGKSFA